MKKLLFCITLFLPLICVASALSEDQLLQEIEQLKSRLVQLENIVNSRVQKKVIHSTEEKSNLSSPSKPEEKIISSAEKKTEHFAPTVKVGANLTNDFASYSSNNNKDNFVSKVRNARINISGQATKEMDYVMEVDFAKDKSTKLKKLYLNYKALDPVAIKLGRFQQDFGMISEDKFPERSPIFCLAEFDENGANISTHGDNWYTSFGVGSNWDEDNNEIDNSKTFFYRGSYSPLYNEKNVVHTGLSFAHHLPRSKKDTLDIEQVFETKLLPDSIDTGKINALRYVNSYGTDFGFINGPFSFQAEFVGSKIKRTVYPTSLFYKGYYALVAYTLSGERRGYDPKYNKFFNLTPANDFSIKDGNYGAWEVAMRYNVIDLNSSYTYTDSKGIIYTGGKMKNLSTSLNWYLSKNMSIMFTYIYGKTDSKAVVPNDKANIFLIRTNLYF